jgi:hypothetical protein
VSFCGTGPDTGKSLCDARYNLGRKSLILAEGVRDFAQSVQDIICIRKTKHRWVDNMEMDLREIGSDGVDWVDMAQDRDQ